MSCASHISHISHISYAPAGLLLTRQRGYRSHSLPNAPKAQPKQPSAARTLSNYFILRSCAAALHRRVRCAVVCSCVCVCVCACACAVRVPVRVSTCALCFLPGCARDDSLTSPHPPPTESLEPLNIQAQSTGSGFLPRLVGNLIRSPSHSS